MDRYTYFGKCLKMMLSALDIKGSSLARVLNVDVSLVNRWLNDKRVPSYRSHYIVHISEYISASILNSFQEKKLNDLLKSLDSSLPDNMSMQDKIKKILLEAQGYSIESRKLKQIGRIKPAGETNYQQNAAVLNISDKSISDSFFKGETAVAYDGLNNMKVVNLNIPRHSISNFSHDDKIILGTDNVLEAILKLLEAASEIQCSRKTMIYISFNNDIDLSCRHFNFKACFKNALYGALKNGWSIAFLLRLDNNINRIVNFIKLIQPLLEMGRLNLYCFTQNNMLSDGKELLIVPGIGALICYSTQPMSDVDCAFYYRNALAIEIILRQISKGIILYSRPAITYFSESNIHEFSEQITDMNRFQGNTYLYMNGFSTAYLPLKAYEKLLRKNCISPAEFTKKLKEHKKCLSSFVKNIKYNRYRDIYTIESIEKFISSGQYLYDGICSGLKFRIDFSDRIEQIKNMITMLKKYKNYEIALVCKNQFDCCSKINAIVKEKHSVKMEIHDGNILNPVHYISIEEPTIVKAFEKCCDELWESIPYINKDKREIISWLEKWI